MKHRNTIIAAVIGVVFVFAGYNLYSYFQTQAEIAAEKERIAEERRIERERQRAEREAERKAEQARLEAERIAAQERREREAAERAAERERERLEAEARVKAEREAREQERREREQARMQERIETARIPQIEDFSPDYLRRIRSLSPEYIRNHPDEALHVEEIPANARVYASQYGTRKLLVDQTTFLMIAAAVSKNPDFIDAILEVGADINAANKQGFTPLMFAAAYNTPEMVRTLIERGADTSAQAALQDMNALHVAAWLNPHPGVIDVLVKAGLPIDGLTKNQVTPLLIASAQGSNLEVAGRLAELGADIRKYGPDGSTPYRLVEDRIRGRGERYKKISDEVNEAVLAKLVL
jgi:multidrug efflux pump subunit AcrA (membrane-fusion protein)